ncbi:chemotaxis protein [Vibrio cortegadensis]|uniref:chemotaxis protein n=1 Tax=Vibrio cortegadensis TaxID=1328770 RepID=UPI0021C2F198|nr:chemotaxis protein [Vibrio cortegadensis]MDN3697780.1 chemotaxis protein [Vibrio cortegadensis]
MGGKSKSSNKTQTTNVSGQNAISGDNLGTAISGVNDSTINVTATDHGAIQAAENMHEINTDFASGVLEEYSSSNSENLQMMAGLAGNQATQNTKNINAMMELAKFNKDGGQSKQNSMNLYLMMFVAAVLGFVTYKAVK